MNFLPVFSSIQLMEKKNPPSLIYASKFQEVQEYLSLTEHVNNFLGFIMNKRLL